MEIKIRLPRIPSGGLSNIVGLLGLLGIVLAVGGLTGNWWWSVLTAGVFGVALAYVAQTHDAVAATAEPVAAGRSEPMARVA